MRRMCALLFVLFIGGIVLAADSPSTPVSAKKTKPAVAPSAAPASAAPAPEAADPEAAAPAAMPAAEPASATAVAPAEAPAPVVTPAPAAVPAQAPEAAAAPAPETPAPVPAPVAQEPEKKPACPFSEKPACKDKAACKACPAGQGASMVSFYGMAQIRLRDDIISNKTKNGVDSLSATFQYPLGYKLGVKVRPNEQALLQFEIGNDWYATDVATGIPGNYYRNRDPITPWFSLAFAQWDPGYMHIQAGIIPVRGTPLMDLLGVSILYDKKYQLAAHVPWGVVTNLSQTGLRIGAPLLKDDVKLGLDLMTAMIEQRSVVAGANTWNYNASSIEFLGELPFSLKGFTATPQVFAIVDRNFNKVAVRGDMEIGAGADLVYKCCEAASIRAGFGYAQNSNANSYAAGQRTLKNPLNPADTSTKAVNPSERSGMNVNVGTCVILGPGKLDFDFNYSTDKDAKDSTVDDAYPFFDLKYGWAINKNFIVKPRIRFFITLPKTVYDSKLTTRPELIFEGSF
jgi:hypothetical protein